MDAYLHEKPITFALAPYVGHIMPLFKLVYYLEFSLFGYNTLLFQIITVSALGLFTYVFSLILGEVSFKENNFMAILIAVLLCAQPSFGNIALFSFQINMILELLFQALAILYYFKFVKDNTTQNFSLFILFVITQNYFFGNGVFFPLVFIFHQILEKRIAIKKTVIVLLLIQLLFILVQKCASDKLIGINYIVQHKFEILKSFYRFVSVSIARFFFVKQMPGVNVIVPGLLIFALLCYWGIKKNRNMFLFGLAYFITSSVTIPIARYGLNESFPYYYSALLLPPLFFLLFIALSGFKLTYTKPIMFICSTLLLCYFILDIQVKRIYSYRDFKNKESLTDAVKYSKKHYYPFDDQCITAYRNLYHDNFQDTGIQNSLEKNANFEMDSAIDNYLGKEAAVRFKSMSNKVIENYKLLSQESKIHMDIMYEKY
jgi:hypothetical protein